MKKVLVVFAVLALTMAMASMAQAEITMDGSIEIMMRSVKNSNDWNDDVKTAGGDYVQTYERVRFGVTSKHEGVDGRLQMETDWDTWADGAGNPGFETRPTNNLYLREAWVNFNMPFGLPGHIKVGRQFLQLGNGWWFRSKKYGSDAWVVGFPGQNTVAFVNVKAAENTTQNADDTDAYVLLDVYKIDDNNSVGAYLVHVNDREGVWTNAVIAPPVASIKTTLNNIGLHYNGVLGPVKLGAELDYQMGEIDHGATTTDLSGMQAVVQASMNMDALTLRATAAMGTGDDATTGDEVEAYLPFLDKDPHYTLVYEYFMNTAAGAKNTAFANTTAIGVGADFKVNDVVTLAADIWSLTADQKVNLNGGTPDTDVGMELDVKVNLKLAAQLSWNTTVGMFMPGKAYENAAGEADNAQAIHSVLSYKF